MLNEIDKKIKIPHDLHKMVLLFAFYSRFKTTWTIIFNIINFMKPIIMLG